METAEITLNADGQHVTMTLHDHATRKDTTWILPRASAKELAERLTEIT